MNRRLSSLPTNSSKARRSKPQSKAQDPLKTLHAYRARLARRFDYDVKRISEYFHSVPLPPGVHRAPSDRKRPDET